MLLASWCRSALPDVRLSGVRVVAVRLAVFDQMTKTGGFRLSWVSKVPASRVALHGNDQMADFLGIATTRGPKCVLVVLTTSV